MKLFLIILLLPITTIWANTYTLHIASTKYKDVAKSYIEEVNDLLKIEHLVVRIHKNKHYSLIVNQIKDRNEAIKIQEKLKNTSYKDTYIKKDTADLKYQIIYYTKMTKNSGVVIKEDEKDFLLDVESSNEYITASTMYNIGNYKRSYELFNNLFYKHNYNVNINYFLAQSAIKIGKLDEASIALERVLIENPKFNKARYDYARLLTKLKLNEEAKKEFNILLKENITDETKKDIEKYLKFLNKKKKYTSNSATIIVGMGHNTNIKNSILVEDYKIDGLDLGEDPIKDNFHNEILSLSFNKILEENKAVKITNNFLAYNKSFFNEKNENTSVIAYKPNISYIHNQNLYSLDLNATRVIKKENKDINVFSISPSISNNKFKTSIEYQKLLYAYEYNDDGDNNKDNNFEKFLFYFKYKLSNNLNISTNISKIIRLRKQRLDIDKITKSLSLYYSYDFFQKNMIYLGYKFEKNNFKYLSGFPFNNKRKDTSHNIMFNYLYSINDYDRINLLASYTNNSSNQDSSEYDQTEVTINYIKKIHW